MSRRGVYRGLYASIFDDPDYQRLSPEARLVLLTLRLCVQGGVATIFRAYVPVLCEQTGLKPDQVDLALEELARTPSPARPWILHEASIVWVRNALKYDPSRRLADSNHRIAVERAIAALPKLSIVRKFCRHYKIRSPFRDPTETLARPREDSDAPRPSTETETETETENEGRAASPPPSPTGFRIVKL